MLEKEDCKETTLMHSPSLFSRQIEQASVYLLHRDEKGQERVEIGDILGSSNVNGAEANSYEGAMCMAFFQSTISLSRVSPRE
jgi:hypothetical protein